MRTVLHTFGLAVLLALGFSGCLEKVRQDAVDSVGSAIRDDAGIKRADLKLYSNPAGEGYFIDAGNANPPKETFVWLYLGGKAYALNAATKEVSPSLPLAREAPDTVLQYATFKRETIETEVMEKLQTVRSEASR